MIEFILIAAGTCVIVSDIIHMRAENRRRREDHRAYMAQAVAEREKEQEYRCRMMMFRTWDEINRRRRKTRNCSIVGCMATQMDELSEGEKAAVYSGRYAKILKEIKRS